MSERGTMPFYMPLAGSYIEKRVAIADLYNM